MILKVTNSTVSGNTVTYEFGEGGVYSVRLRVRDASGNTTRATRQVTVPLSQNGSPAIDGGPQYTVTSNCP